MSKQSPRIHLAAILALTSSGAALLSADAAEAQKMVKQRIETSSESRLEAGAADAAARPDGAAVAADAKPETAAKPTEAPGAGAAAPEASAANANANPPSAPAGASADKAAAAQPAGGKVDRGVAATSAAVAASRAEAEKRDRAEDEGVDDDRDVVKPVLAKHPDSNLVICIAGCGPDPQIVQVLPKEPEKRTESQVIPNSANAANAPAGAPAADSKPATGEIRCIAGCNGKRGEVVFKRARISWIEPGESERVRHALREIAERLSVELKVISTAEQSQTLTSWAGMSRQALAASTHGATLADASGEAAR